MNALADKRVINYFNETFVCTYLKVGTFQIVGGQKQGGNVASYFCLPDGSVLHALAGKTDGDKLLLEGRWAYETRKAALTFSTRLGTSKVDLMRYKDLVSRAHQERYHAELNPFATGLQGRSLPAKMPKNASQQVQTHWVLAKSPLTNVNDVYPLVWTQILNEQLSGLPVARR